MRIGSKEDLAARKLAADRTDPQYEWFYTKYTHEDPVHLCGKGEAENVVYMALQKHPVDGHEFGLRVTSDRLVEGIPDNIKKILTGSITAYLYANPDGKPTEGD